MVMGGFLAVSKKKCFTEAFRAYDAYWIVTSLIGSILSAAVGGVSASIPASSANAKLRDQHPE